jgi:LysM repeat protein
MTPRLAVTLALVCAISGLWLILSSARIAGAQAPTPADEPTKPPYVFPTPPFIPTFPAESPAPPGPKATATRAAVQTTGDRTYTVVAGDNPWKIAEKVYGNGAKSTIILAANGITDPTKLRVGMVLKIPATDTNGQLVAAVAPTIAPTVVPATPVPPTSQPTPLTPVPSRVPTPGPNTIGPGIATAAVTFILNIVGSILIVAALICGLLAFLVYRRTLQVQAMTAMAHRIRIRI